MQYTYSFPHMCMYVRVQDKPLSCHLPFLCSKRWLVSLGKAGGMCVPTFKCATPHGTVHATACVTDTHTHTHQSLCMCMYVALFVGVGEMGQGVSLLHIHLPHTFVTDYELQLQLLEAVFRLSDAKQRGLLAKLCFKDQQLAVELKNINPKELDVVRMLNSLLHMTTHNTPLYV